MSDALHLKVVAGLSGSGISTAINALEDLDYFCIDGLPPPMLPKLLELAASGGRYQHLALGLDTRNVLDAEATIEQLRRFSESGVTVTILFLEASSEVLLRRFSVTRRPHPMGRELPLPQAIAAERIALNPLREIADEIVDSSDFNVHELKRAVQAFASGEKRTDLWVSVMSFGFRHGVPTEADIVWDVRFLANPHFVPELSALTGLHPPVAQFVLEHPTTVVFLQRFLPLLDAVLPAYQQEGKSYLTIAIGCTGGQHRSVAIAERIAEHIRAAGADPKVRHRDMPRGPTQTPQTALISTNASDTANDSPSTPKGSYS